MTKHTDPETLQRRRWRKALRIAHILFEEDGYYTKYLSEIEAFIRLPAPEPQAALIMASATPAAYLRGQNVQASDKYGIRGLWPPS